MAANRKRLESLKTLRLQDGASLDEIRKAYKKLALELHPDKAPEDSEATGKFQNLNEAYKYLLSDHEEEADPLDWEEFRDFVERFMQAYYSRSCPCCGSNPFGVDMWSDDDNGQPEYAKIRKGKLKHHKERVPSKKWFRKQEKRAYHLECDPSPPRNMKIPVFNHNKQNHQAVHKPKRSEKVSRTAEATDMHYSDDINTDTYHGTTNAAQDTQVKTENAVKKEKTSQPQPTQPKKLTKKQLLAEQQRREKEIAKIAAELEVKRQKEVEKEQKKEVEKEQKKQENAETGKCNGSGDGMKNYQKTCSNSKSEIEKLVQQSEKEKLRQQHLLEEAARQPKTKAKTKKKKKKKALEESAGQTLPVPVYHVTDCKRDGQHTPGKSQGKAKEEEIKPKVSSAWELGTNVPNKTSAPSIVKHGTWKPIKLFQGEPKFKDRDTDLGPPYRKKDGTVAMSSIGRVTYRGIGRSGSAKTSTENGIGDCDPVMQPKKQHATAAPQFKQPAWNIPNTGAYARCAAPQPLFPALSQAAGPPVASAWSCPLGPNVWQQRREFYDSAVPANSAEEEAMLQAALEMSRLQAQQEELSRKIQEEEVSLQRERRLREARQALQARNTYLGQDGINLAKNFAPVSPKVSNVPSEDLSRAWNCQDLEKKLQNGDAWVGQKVCSLKEKESAMVLSEPALVDDLDETKSDGWDSEENWDDECIDVPLNTDYCEHESVTSGTTFEGTSEQLASVDVSPCKQNIADDHNLQFPATGSLSQENHSEYECASGSSSTQKEDEKEAWTTPASSHGNPQIPCHKSQVKPPQENSVTQYDSPESSEREDEDYFYESVEEQEEVWDSDDGALSPTHGLDVTQRESSHFKTIPTLEWEITKESLPKPEDEDTTKTSLLEHMQSSNSMHNETDSGEHDEGTAGHRVNVNEKPLLEGKISSAKPQEPSVSQGGAEASPQEPSVSQGGAEASPQEPSVLLGSAETSPQVPLHPQLQGRLPVSWPLPFGVQGLSGFPVGPVPAPVALNSVASDSVQSTFSSASGTSSAQDQKPGTPTKQPGPSNACGPALKQSVATNRPGFRPVMSTRTGNEQGLVNNTAQLQQLMLQNLMMTGIPSTGLPTPQSLPNEMAVLQANGMSHLAALQAMQLQMSSLGLQSASARNQGTWGASSIPVTGTDAQTTTVTSGVQPGSGAGQSRATAVGFQSPSMFVPGFQPLIPPVSTNGCLTAGAGHLPSVPSEAAKLQSTQAFASGLPMNAAKLQAMQALAAGLPSMPMDGAKLQSMQALAAGLPSVPVDAAQLQSARAFASGLPSMIPDAAKFQAMQALAAGLPSGPTDAAKLQSMQALAAGCPPMPTNTSGLRATLPVPNKGLPVVSNSPARLPMTTPPSSAAAFMGAFGIRMAGGLQLPGGLQVPLMTGASPGMFGLSETRPGLSGPSAVKNTIPTTSGQ